jgi:hypothetical protein
MSYGQGVMGRNSKWNTRIGLVAISACFADGACLTAWIQRYSSAGNLIGYPVIPS